MPASASAATLSVTGDDGVPQALSGQTIRNMSPQLAVGINGTTERSYTVQVIGPNGVSAASATCLSSPTPRTVNYQGNGVYTVYVAIYTTLLCTDTPTTGLADVRDRRRRRDRVGPEHAAAHPPAG